MSVKEVKKHRQLDSKEVLERRLKQAKIGFWVNFVCVVINLLLYFFLQHWYPAAIGILCTLLAFVYVHAEKSILQQLGREKEI